jgi:peptidoglycan/LPS O-acetylase OafA/YrhL
VPQAWAISCIAWFYLLAPFIVQRRSNAFLGALALLGCLIRLFIYYGVGLRHDPWTYRFFPAEILFFVLGALSYRLWVRTGAVERIPGIVSVLVLLLFCGLLLGFQLVPAGLIRHVTLFAALFVVLPILWMLTSRLRWDRRLGIVSMYNRKLWMRRRRAYPSD